MEYAPRTFTLPTIPGLSPDQINLHLGLYAGYVKHVNVLATQMNKLAAFGDEYDYAIAALRRRLGFEWNGMRLHELYFETIEEGPSVLRADSALYAKIAEQYGSFANWLDIFTKVSARGPGWAILVYDPRGQRFFHVWVSDHEHGQLATLPVLIALDHWEHAYLVDYQPSEKDRYVRSYLDAINWTNVAQRFDEITKV